MQLVIGSVRARDPFDFVGGHGEPDEHPENSRGALERNGASNCVAGLHACARRDASAAAGVVPVHRRKARKNALGSEKPNR